MGTAPADAQANVFNRYCASVPVLVLSGPEHAKGLYAADGDVLRGG